MKPVMVLCAYRDNADPGVAMPRTSAFQLHAKPDSSVFHDSIAHDTFRTCCGAS